MRMSWNYALVVAVVAIILIVAFRYAYSAGGDAFVRMLEAREGMYPGRTRVIPECGCTVRYLGTRVNGRVYSVELEKLD